MFSNVLPKGVCPECGMAYAYGERQGDTCYYCEKYGNEPTIEKRKKEHVVDGNNWWRIKRNGGKGNA